MKLPIVLTLLAATVSLADPVRKALPFGDALPVQALQPRIKYPTHDNGTLPLYTQDSGSLPGVGKSVVITTNDEDEDRHHDTDTHQTHWDVSHNPSLPSFLFKPSKRATIDCGTFIMDCSTARGACNNACYYQNCVKGGQTIRYQDYGDDEDTQYDNRVQAGTKLSGGATCRSLPLSQRMYDQYPDWATALPNLQTDEWPMAATVQDDFQSGVIRNTLRCIPGTENGNAGNQYKDFRLEHGKFKPGGKYATARTCSGVFTGDQTFEVLFDISAMTSLEIDEIVPYCKPNPDCTNDGRQFHLSKLAYTKMKKSGKWGWPYDVDKMNNFMITGESDPIEAFQVKVILTGLDDEQVEATVSRYRSGQMQVMGRNSN